MPHFDWKILCFLLLLLGCKYEKYIENQVVVNVSQAIVRAEPSEKSRELITIGKGQILTDLGEVGPSESLVAQGNEVYQSPWIKVQTADNQTGWVLAWAIKPVQQQKDWLLQKRMNCYFGKALTMQRNAVFQSFENLKTEQQLSDLWHTSTVLRDTFLQLISSRPEGDYKLQFDWLNAVLPGFIFQKNELKNRPELFADFKFWSQNALKTDGLQDNAFFQASFMAFSKDSIESFFPSWKFQISESESASQLGIGQHIKMLQQIDLSLQGGPLFASLLMQFKDQVLEDVFEKGVRYWQPKDKILEELGQILSNPPKCLSQRELEALSIRQKMFEDPSGNGIVVNLRSGE